MATEPVTSAGFDRVGGMVVFDEPALLIHIPQRLADPDTQALVFDAVMLDEFVGLLDLGSREVGTHRIFYLLKHFVQRDFFFALMLISYCSFEIGSVQSSQIYPVAFG